MTTRLILTMHAEQRAHYRGISVDDILRVVRTGKRTAVGSRVLHYHLPSRLGVVVNWRELKVVTVMHLNDSAVWRLRTQEAKAL